MSSPYVFEPSARLQRLLSRELISDPNLAVVELVKNGYDAGATRVRVDLTTSSPGRLVISDDGVGMTEVEFRSNWMRPGFSEKARVPGKPVKVNGKNRVPVGEKGLGRLAAGRLGEVLTVYTRTAHESDWFRLVINWSRFDDMDEALSKVKFRGSRVADAPGEAFAHGTVLVIEELVVDLAGKIPGRKVVGRPDNRFGRLAQDLRLLTTSAEGGAKQKFQIELAVDDPDLLDHAGTFEGATALSKGQFRYDFEIIPDKEGRTYISRTVWQGGLTLDEGQVLIDLKGRVTDVGELSIAPHPAKALAGKLKGSFVYAPPAKGQRVVEPNPPGVFLYRDGVRVEPYGEPESDWLGAYARKAARQGHAPIQPKHLYGSVHIGRAANPKLNDMANRQGLIENAEFENLLSQVRAEFAYFGQVVQDHRTTPQWEESQAKKRQAAAQERVDVSRAQSRSLAHAVRQPLTGIDAELFTLGRLARDQRIPDDLQEAFLESRDRLKRAATDIASRVQTFLQASDEAVSDFPLSGVFEEVEERLAAVCESRDAEVMYASTDVRMSFARGVLVEALVELVTNALAAEDVLDRQRGVIVMADAVEGAVEIAILDNGPGLPDSRMATPFEVGESRSGRPGHGLVMQKLNLLGAGGNLDLRKSNLDGTQFVITLPASSVKLKVSD